MKILEDKQQVKNIENNNEYILTIKSGSGFGKHRVDYIINYYDDIHLQIRKEDSRNNIEIKDYFRKSVRSIFNIIAKN